MNKATTLKDFEILGRLGEGSFASVYKARRYDDQTTYALKKVKIGQMSTKQKENALNEVRILASTSHPNIINYKQAFFDDASETLCTVMELAQSGDLLKKCNDHIKAKTFFKEDEIWKALIHMTKGLKTLHDMNILHRDLKCANVFVSNEGVYKLGDLNVSKVSKRGMARTHTGTPYYTSPQVWKDREYDLKCDIWSLGCVIYQMATLKPPFRAGNLKQLYTKIQKGMFDRLPSFYSDDLQTMIAQLIKVNPSLRPTTVQILNNSIVSKKIPSEDYYRPEPKGSLLKTIIVPKNLKHIKDLLPGAKYEIKALDVDNNISHRIQQRASSVRSLRGNDSQKRMQVLHSFRRQIPSRNREYSYDNINKSKDSRDPPESNRIPRQKQKVPQLAPMSNLSRNRSREALVQCSVNKGKERNISLLKKQQAQISKNVARALEKVNKIDKQSGNISGRNLPSKPRSQSVDRLYRAERDKPVRDVRENKENRDNKYRIFAPPLYRPPSRNNLDKKYLPPQPRIY